MRGESSSVRHRRNLCGSHRSFLFPEETSWLVRDNITLVGAFVNRLWEWIDGLVVLWVIFLIRGSDVPLLISPGVKRRCPLAVALDGEIVHTSADTEEALLSPVSAP